MTRASEDPSRASSRWVAGALAALAAVACSQSGGGPPEDPHSSARSSLTAGPAFLLVDADTEPDAYWEPAHPEKLTVAGNKVYFVASKRLWVTDGTSDGTTELDPAIDATIITAMRGAGGLAYFVVQPTFAWPYRSGLWRSDGTRAGTRLVASFDETARALTDVQGLLYFVVGEWDLWKSDGTPEGTHHVATLGSGFDRMGRLAPLGDKVAVAWEAGQQGELWISDGTSAGTQRVYGGLTSRLMALEPAEDSVYFVARDQDGATALWRSDGSSLGTAPVRDTAGRLFTTAGFGTNWRSRAIGRTLFFVAEDRGHELWRTDGAAEGTRRVSALNSPSMVLRLEAVRSKIFLATGGTSSRLWVSDGTEEGSSDLSAIGLAGTFVAVGDRLFFTSRTTEGERFWVSDGTREGTRILRSDIRGSSDTRRDELVDMAGTAVFWAFDEVNYSQLWRSDGTSDGTRMVVDLSVRSTRASDLWPLGVAGSNFYVTDQTADRWQYRLWQTDGTPAGTAMRLVLPSSPVGDWLASPYIHGIGAVGDKLVFRGYGPMRGLWRTDGSSEGTVFLADTGGEPGVSLTGRLYFASAGQIWRTDGSIEGTGPITAVFGGLLGEFTVMGDRFYFLHTRELHSRELWRSDGTSEGTTLVARLPGRVRSSSYLAAGGRTLYFLSPESEPTMLWRSDGTSDGTVPVRTVRDFGEKVAVAGETLFFHGALGDAALWGLVKSDGTSDGTVLLRAIAPKYITAAGDKVFLRSGGYYDGELWVSDGTSEGTRRLLDRMPWPELGRYFVPLEREGMVLFDYCDDSHGCELWKSDGTTEGTVLVADVYPGYQWSSPQLWDRFGGVVAFAARHPVTGRELWAVHVGDLAPLSCPGDVIAEAASADGATVDFAAEVSPRYEGTVVYRPAPGTRFPIGRTLVTARAIEARQRCSFAVVVQDTTPPSLVCPDVVAEAEGAGGAVVAYAATVLDVVSVAATEYSHPSGSTFPLGTTRVAVTARDDAGNVATCAFSVVVRDTKPPQITCPENVRVEATGPDGAAAQWPAADASDSVSTPAITYAPELGTLLPLGESLVAAQARDSAGNSSRCSFSVLVEDTTAPRIDCPARVFVEANGPEGGAASWDVVISDLVSEPVVTSSLEPGTSLPFGDTALELLAVDAVGNASRCELLLTVRDSLPPDIVCPSDFAVVAGEGGATLALPPARAQDRVTSTPVVAIQGGEQRNLAPGIHVIEASATDEAGNRSTCTFMVTVTEVTTSAAIGCGCGADEPGAALWFVLAVAGLSARLARPRRSLRR